MNLTGEIIEAGKELHEEYSKESPWEDFSWYKAPVGFQMYISCFRTNVPSTLNCQISLADPSNQCTLRTNVPKILFLKFLNNVPHSTLKLSLKVRADEDYVRFYLALGPASRTS